MQLDSQNPEEVKLHAVFENGEYSVSVPKPIALFADDMQEKTRLFQISGWLESLVSLLENPKVRHSIRKDWIRNLQRACLDAEMKELFFLLRIPNPQKFLQELSVDTTPVVADVAWVKKVSVYFSMLYAKNIRRRKTVVEIQRILQKRNMAVE